MTYTERMAAAKTAKATKPRGPTKPKGGARRKGKPVEFEAVSARFAAANLTDRKGMRAAAKTLAQVRAGGSIDPRWGPRAADLFATPFPKDFAHDDARHELFHEAGMLLLELGNAAVVPRLIETLGGVAKGPDRHHNFVVDLVGRLGAAAELPALLDWINKQTKRTVGSGSAFAVYAVLVNTLVRLKSPKTVALIRKRLRLADAEQLILDEYERFAFEKALELIENGDPPDYGFTFLPKDTSKQTRPRRG